MLEKGVNFEHKLIDLSNKPADFLEKYQLASGRSYGSGLVPLLEHGDKLVIESDVVTKYISKHIKGVGKGDGLYPTNEEDVELINTFLDEWGSVTDRYYSILTATSQKEVDRCVAKWAQRLETIESILKQRTTGDYLLGTDVSYAECISAPWIQRFYVTLPYFRGINFHDDILLANNLQCLSEWMDKVCNRPSCIESKCPEDEMIAACKRYYVSYISPNASGVL